MSLVTETINKCVRDKIAEITGLTTIAAEQNAPRPLGEYATVKVSTLIATGWDDVTQTNQSDPDEDLDELIQGMRLTSMSINFFRGLAVDSATKFYDALQRSNIQQFFKECKLGLVSRSDIRDLTEQVDAELEPRAQFDLNFHTVATDADIVFAIKSLNITGEYHDSSTPGGEYSQPIEVTES